MAEPLEREPQTQPVPRSGVAVARPPLPETPREVLTRWLARVAALRPAPAPWVPPEPPDASEVERDERQRGPSRRFTAGRLTTMAASAAAFVVLVVLFGGLVVAGLVGWERWQERAVPAAEELIPLAVAPPPPTLAPAPVPSTAPGGEGSAVETAAGIIVHVAGAVRSPGLVELPDGARVADAIDGAGGLTIDADEDRLNLAAHVSDGQRIYALATDEDVAPPASPSSAGGSSGAAEAAGPVDINSATQGELESLPGVGPATATAIIEHRARRGSFFEPKGLLDVPGIGPAKFASLESLVVAG